MMLSLIRNSFQQRFVWLCAFFLTALVHAFADPLRYPPLAALASTVNLALLFRLIASRCALHRFLLASSWYAIAFGIPFRWFATTTYHGVFILVAYALVVLLFSIQFGLFALLLKRSLSLSEVFALTGFWVLMEWMRLFLLSGSIWYPFGLALSWSTWSSQVAQIGGVYALSGCVVLANLLFFRFLNRLTLRRFLHWFLATVLPFAIGGMFLLQTNEKGKSLRVAAVQTGLEVDQRGYFHDRPGRFIHPLLQWDNHFSHLKKRVNGPVDLILFPESLTLFSPFAAVYKYEDVRVLFSRHFPKEDISAASPSLEDKQFAIHEDGAIFVSNAFIAQTLSNLYNASVVVGLDHTDVVSGNTYNSAWHFTPGDGKTEWYGKRMLVPIAEYIPSQWFRKVARRYGIEEFFSSGPGPVILQGKVAMAPSICYEECFGNLMRSNKQAGAELLLNLSNDGWFPATDLPHAHFIHCRLRTVEMGIPLLRACHTGSTAYVDSKGRIVEYLSRRQGDGESQSDVIYTTIECAPLRTLYTMWGDSAVVFLSVLILVYSYALRKIALDKKRISAVNS